MAQRGGGGFFSSLSKAVDDIATSVDSAAKNVSSEFDSTVNHPMTHLKIGNIVILTSRTCVNKCLLLDANGVPFCSGNPQYVDNLPSQFEVIGGTLSNTAIKFRNMAYPQYHLAIVNGYFIGNGQGGPECDFYGRYIPNVSTFVALESAASPGSHIGVLPTGQFTAPAQTSPKTTNAAHFKVKFIKRVPGYTPPAQRPPPQAQHPQGQPAYPQGQPTYPPPGQPYAPPGQQGYAAPPTYPQPPYQQQPPPGQAGPVGQKQGYPPPTNYPPPSAP